MNRGETREGTMGEGGGGGSFLSVAKGIGRVARALSRPRNKAQLMG